MEEEMITDPCTCGTKPTSHAHVVNSEKKDEILWFKGAPIIMDDPKEKEYFILNTKQKITLPTRRKGKLKKVV